MSVKLSISVPNWLDKICTWPVLLYRRQRYGCSYRKISLGEGRFTIVDPQDFYSLNNFQWCAEGKDEKIYAVRNIISRDMTRTSRLHREIMNAPPCLWVDHRNGDGLDNRRENLRLATCAQNARNRRKTKSKTSSRFVGVSFDKRGGRWKAYIKFQAKRIWLGRYDDEIDAARAYDLAAKKYHGEFARLNFTEQKGKSPKTTAPLKHRPKKSKLRRLVFNKKGLEVMKKHLMVVAIVSLVGSILVFGINSVFAMAGQSPQKEMVKVSSDIRLNSLGFLPAAQKKATIISKCSAFSVKEASKGDTVYSGKVTGPFTQKDVNGTVWIADFSKVNKPGKYFLDVPGVGRSYEFEIGDKIYDLPFYTTMRAFYLWRCGTEVNAFYNGNRFYHAACHMNDAWLNYLDVNEPNTKKDGTGGWHDAGDYNKYVVNAGVTVAPMFLAWEQFGEKLKKFNLDLPDTAPGYPDYLKELKWETDWLLKMQYPDNSGRISHKVSTLTFGGFILPERETEKRYFVGWSSAATADFVAMMAMAARNFKPYDANYAQTCLAAAKKSYDFLRVNRDNKMSDQREKGFRTGGYPTTDQDDRMWASIEMWETTGEPNYLRDFERMAMSYEDKIDFYWDWGNVKNLAMFTYVLSKREGKRDALVEDAKRDLVRTADMIVIVRNKDVYGRCLGDEYRWGSTGAVAREVLTLQIANKVSPNQEYIDTSLDAIGHLFGRNYYCRSFVTGLGYQPPMNPHDRRSGGDRVRDPWPGYIIGGGHFATDWQDIESDARTNEIAINWQAALVYALAGFVDGGPN